MDDDGKPAAVSSSTMAFPSASAVLIGEIDGPYWRIVPTTATGPSWAMAIRVAMPGDNAASPRMMGTRSVSWQTRHQFSNQPAVSRFPLPKFAERVGAQRADGLASLAVFV